MHYFQFTIQSASARPEYLMQQIDDFLPKFVATERTEEEFQEFKKAVHTNLSRKPVKLSEQNGRYWGEIFNSRLDFDLLENRKAALESITLQDVIDYLNEYILSSEKRKMMVFLTSSAKFQEDPELAQKY